MYRSVTIAHVLAVFVSYAISSWLPALYLRQFDLGQSEVGVTVGLINFLGGVPGLLLGGILADRLGKQDCRWYGRVPAIALVFAVPVLVVALWMPNQAVATVLFGCGFLLYQTSHAPGLAVIQRVLHPSVRAQGAAFVFFLANLLGMGFGPLLTGFLSDQLMSGFGAQSLSMAMSAALLVLGGASVWYWRTGVALANTTG